MSRLAVFRWSVGLGRWWGATVEVHLLLLLGCVAALAIWADAKVIGAVVASVWMASVVLHQLMHVLVVQRVGGELDTVVVGPSGELHAPRVPDEPEPQVLVAIVGPALHLGLAIAAVGALIYYGLGAADAVLLLHPIAAAESFSMADGIGLTIAKVVLWLNWSLFLLNMLPAYPFDGAVILRSLLWPMVGRRTAYIVTGRLAQAAAVALMFCGLYLATMVHAEPHVWVIPVMLALYLAVAAQRDWHALSQFERDAYDDAYVQLERDELEAEDWLRDDANHMVLVEQHYDQLRERYERKRKAQEDYEDARVDDILARLHSEGFDHLSQEDQAFLKRASRRYRDRRRERDFPAP